MPVFDLYEMDTLHTSPKFLSRATCQRRTLHLLLPKRHSTQLIYKRATLFHTTWHTAIARRDIQARVSCEEVPRSEQQRHRLCRHDREILWTGEVCDAKCVPEHNICVGQVGSRILLNPCWNALRWLA
jgi:hypothetical protein